MRAPRHTNDGSDDRRRGGQRKEQKAAADTVRPSRFKIGLNRSGRRDVTHLPKLYKIRCIVRDYHSRQIGWEMLAGTVDGRNNALISLLLRRLVQHEQFGQDTH